MINEISGRRTSQRVQIQGDTQEERILNWNKHFAGLFGSEPEAIDADVDIPPIFADLGIKEGPFNVEEYVKAKKALTEGKASGEDGITPEILKRCNIDDIILEFCNTAMSGGNDAPDHWSVINIIPIPKSGDLSLGGNYRGISLSSLVAKVYNKMILNRIRPQLDPFLRPNQNGFRTGRTTTSQILALRRIIEGIKEYNLKAVITFIDFQEGLRHGPQRHDAEDSRGIWHPNQPSQCNSWWIQKHPSTSSYARWTNRGVSDTQWSVTG